MKYAKIAALVPANEHFDPTAINGEGVWLTTAHLEAMENQLLGDGTTIESKIAELTEAQNQLAEKTTALQTANADIVAKATRIMELEGELAARTAASGDGTPLHTQGDPDPAPAPVPAYLDDNAPENQWFDKQAKFL